MATTNIPSFPTTYTNRKGEEKPISQPSRPLNEGIKTNNLTQTFDSGHEQRRAKGDPKRSFEFTFNALLEEEAQAIVTFFVRCYGSVKSFYWTHPITKESILVRFDMDAMAKENFSHGPLGPIYKINVKLIQVF